MLETATTHTCYWWIKIPDWDKGTEQSVCTWKGLIFCNCNLKYFRIVHHPNYKFLFKVIIVLCRASGNLCRHCGTNASYMASTNVQFKPPDRYGGWCLKAIFFAHQANNTAKPNVKGPSGGNKKCLSARQRFPVLSSLNRSWSWNSSSRSCSHNFCCFYLWKSVKKCFFCYRNAP